MSIAVSRPQADGIHFVLSSLGSILVDSAGVRSFRGEDPSGNFGLLPGHADFLTVLNVGVLSWRDGADQWRHCAVRRGILTMRRGCELAIATREAVLGDDLDQLEKHVLTELTRKQSAEDAARRQARQLEVRALSELVRTVKHKQPQVWP